MIEYFFNWAQLIEIEMIKFNYFKRGIFADYNKGKFVKKLLNRKKITDDFSV